jgi:hypothetical protein
MERYAWRPLGEASWKPDSALGRDRVSARFNRGRREIEASGRPLRGDSGSALLACRPGGEASLLILGHSLIPPCDPFNDGRADDVSALGSP